MRSIGRRRASLSLVFAPLGIMLPFGTAAASAEDYQEVVSDELALVAGKVPLET